MMTYLRGSLLQTTGTKTLKNGLTDVYGGAVGMVLFPTSSISEGSREVRHGPFQI